jgi:hypothetical protein
VGKPFPTSVGPCQPSTSAPSGTIAGRQVRQEGAHPPTAAPGSSVRNDPEAPPTARTRLQQGIRQPRKYTDGTIHYSFLCAIGEPQNLSEALDNAN